jgi:dGTPase
MIDAVVEHSLRVGRVEMDAPTLEVMNELRDFMFERVYQAPEQLAEQTKAVELIRDLVDHHLAHPDEIPATYRDNDAPLPVQVADYVAGMTDRYALTTHERLFGA